MCLMRCIKLDGEFRIALCQIEFLSLRKVEIIIIKVNGDLRFNFLNETQVVVFFVQKAAINKV